MGFLTAFASGALQEGIAQQNSAAGERERMVEFAMERVREHAKKRDADLERQVKIRGQAGIIGSNPEYGINADEAYRLLDSDVPFEHILRGGIDRRPPAAAAPDAAGGLAGEAPGGFTRAQTASNADATGWVRQVTRPESGGRADAKNPRSSATGAHQFTQGTWLETVREHAPELTRGKSTAEILAMRNDPNFSEAMAVAHVNSKIDPALQRAGIERTGINRYAGWHFGPEGGLSIARASDDTPMRSVASPDALKANPHLANMTVGQWKQRYGGFFSQPADTQVARTPPATADQRSSSAIAAPPPVRAEGTISAPAPTPRDPNEGIRTDSDRVRNLGPVAGGVLDALFGRRNPTAGQLQSARERMADAIGLPRSELERLGQPRERAGMPPGFSFRYRNPEHDERMELEGYKRTSAAEQARLGRENDIRVAEIRSRNGGSRSDPAGKEMSSGDSAEIIRQLGASIGDDGKNPIRSFVTPSGQTMIQPRMLNRPESRAWQQRIDEAQTIATRAYREALQSGKPIGHSEARDMGLAHLRGFQPGQQTATPAPSSRTPAGTPQQQAATPPQVRSAEDYARLKPGEEYLDPQGQRRRKGS